MRPKEKLHSILRDQMGFLRASLNAFYDGNFAESVVLPAKTGHLI
jgi:hypothetical protein